ncbi:hypothetical protein F8A10_16905 [Paracoccus kondratievae]|uniref:hypothetical protein n=1 Tax=Paracoccus kondratievae TaxID=135740 RepID=UPI0012667BE7|nr:hypothetical protein [Paracoccus kondratievae]QFQ89080.1 hypothetical protein F8A10_16905 [Paracoccus kondratievae]
MTATVDLLSPGNAATPPHRDIRDGIPMQMQAGLDQTKQANTRQGTSNEKWPDPTETSVTVLERWLDDSGRPKLEYFDNHGGKFVQLDRDTNPQLYDYLERHQEFSASERTYEYAETQADEFDAIIWERDRALPHLKDIGFAEMRGDAVTLETNEGDRFVVTRQLAPGSFDAAIRLARTVDGIRMSEEQGYKNTIEDVYSNDQIQRAKIGWEDEVGPGMIRAEIPVGDDDIRKVIVSEELNPNLYDRLVSARDGFVDLDGQIDDARDKRNLPKPGDVDPLGMETTETVSKDDDTKLTVSGLAWRETLDGWKRGIEEGSIDKDDDRAKLYDALRAKTILDDGTKMVALDMSMGQNLVDVNHLDMAAIIDASKLDTNIADLMSSESIQNDYIAAQDKAIKSLPDADKVHKRLSDVAFSDDYADYISDLKQNGDGDLAEADIARTYAGLAAFDKEEAGKFAQTMLLNGLTADLDQIIADPGSVSEENEALATKDVLVTVLTTLKKGGIDVPRRTVDTLDKFVNEFLNDKQQAKSFNAVLQELGDKFNKNGTLTQADIEKVAASNGKDIFKALNERSDGAALSVLGELNSNGTLGSVGGAISLASGIYQLTGKGGTLADTPEERVAIAKEFVSFLGAGQHFANLGSNIYDKILGTNANKMLGLDKTLPQIFSRENASGGTPFTPEIGERFVQHFEAVLDEVDIDGTGSLSKRLNLSESDVKEIRKGIENGYVKNPELPGSTNFSRMASAALRIMDAGANVFTGVADVVLGGLSIKRGVGAGDAGAIASGAIQIAAGAFTFGGGAATGAATAGRIGAAIGRALAGPLLGVGALLGAIAFLPSMIIDDIKHNNNMKKHREDMKDLFSRLDGQDVLMPDGAQRYEYLDKYLYSYGQRDAPDDQSIFDYRPEEWQFYKDNGHLPSPGFDDVEHKDYKGDGDNLDTRMDRLG